MNHRVPARLLLLRWAGLLLAIQWSGQLLYQHFAVMRSGTVAGGRIEVYAKRSFNPIYYIPLLGPFLPYEGFDIMVVAGGRQSFWTHVDTPGDFEFEELSADKTGGDEARESYRLKAGSNRFPCPTCPPLSVPRQHR